MAFELDAVKDDPEFQTFVKSQTTEAVNAAVAELQSKNQEILGEKKKLQDMMKKFDGVDIEKAQKALEFLDKDERAKLLSEGKFDEVLESHTEKITSQYQEQIDTLVKERDEAVASGQKHQSLYERTMVDSEIRKIALAEGVLPDAVEDVLLRARTIFSFGEDGTVEARNAKGELMKVDDKILTPSSFIKNLPRHYWPASEGTDAEGGKLSDKDAQLASAAASGNHNQYRKIRRSASKK